MILTILNWSSSLRHRDVSYISGILSDFDVFFLRYSLIMPIVIKLEIAQTDSPNNTLAGSRPGSDHGCYTYLEGNGMQFLDRRKGVWWWKGATL